MRTPIPWGEAHIGTRRHPLGRGPLETEMRKNRRAVKVDGRMVTSPVLQLTPDGWAVLVVEKCETTTAETWWLAGFSGP